MFFKLSSTKKIANKFSFQDLIFINFDFFGMFFSNIVCYLFQLHFLFAKFKYKPYLLLFFFVSSLMPLNFPFLIYLSQHFSVSA